jgi:transposase
MLMTIEPEDARAYIQILETQVKNSNTQYELYKNKYEQIENKYQEIEKEKTQIEEEKRRLENENNILREKLKLALHRKFVKGTEVFFGQPLLFDSQESAAPAAEAESEEKSQVKAHTRSKRGRKPISPDIPRNDPVIIDIPEEDKHCACGGELTCIGYDKVERLCIIPEQVYVEVHHILKYACRKCEGSGDEQKPAVRSGKVPANIMPGSIATAELLSYIFTKKYCDYVPYYRQEAGFERIGVSLSRQNMSHWQIKACRSIEPLFLEYKKHLLKGEVINTDETEMLVMDEEGRENKQRSRMWLTRGGPPGRKVLWYEYHATREAQYVVDLLSGWAAGRTVYLQTDGYEGYEAAKKSLPGVVHVACMAHIRRRFYEASKAVAKGGEADNALARIKAIYNIESDLRGRLEDKKLTPLEFIAKRREKAGPLLDAFYSWLVERQDKYLPSSAMGDAIKYALGQWNCLVHYLGHWELTPDNNSAERAIRPFVMGRKNWVASGSPDGAASSCRLYSLIETAKENHKNPYQYLKFVFSAAAEMSPCDDWSKLLPWNMPA